MFDNGLPDWDHLAGDGVHSSYSSYSHEKGNHLHIWRDIYERGELELIIANRAGRYKARLASSCHADGKDGVRLGEVSTMTFNQYSHLGECTAIAKILRDLDKEFGSAFEDIIGRVREFWRARHFAW